jgi:hypothetical protein
LIGALARRRDTRAHMGFANPALEIFGVRSEDRRRRARSAKEPAKPEVQVSETAG